MPDEKSAVFTAIKVLKGLQQRWPNLVAVKDSPEELFFDITPTHCANASRQDPSSCAAALGLLDISDDALVLRTYAFVYSRIDLIAYRFRVPTRLRNAAVNFDQTGAFPPGRYWLSPPPAGDRIGRTIKKLNGSARGPYAPRKSTKIEGARATLFSFLGKERNGK